VVGDACQVRPCEPADATAIVELFRRSFKTPYELETWRWKYAEGPWARPELSVVVQRGSSEIVGHLGAMLHPINVIGRPRVVAQGTDFMVDERLREQGVFRVLVESYLAGVADAGIPMCLGFPNEPSLPGLQLLATHVAIMEKYYLRLGGAHHTRLRERVNAAPERSRLRFEFDPCYALDPRYDDVWRSCSKLESLSVWKDREYLSWKYGSAPAAHRFCTLEFAREIVALGVCRENGKQVRIVDLIARDKNIHASRALMLFLADHYLGRGFEELRFVGRDPWFFAEVFSEFERRPAFWGNVVARALDRGEAFLYENPLNWTIVSGDSDS
jgi:predicted N-acetyltransferase YhbS